MSVEKLYEKRNEIINSVKGAKTNEELDNLEFELRKIELEIKNFKQPNEEIPPEARSKNKEIPKEANKFDLVASYRNVQQCDVSDDVFASVEYRKAFKDYIVKNIPMPEKFIQKRANSLTTVADISAVIPTTILNQVIEDMTVEGKILARITQTSYQGGVQIPISEVNPTATWIGSENKVSDEQKAKMEAKLSFAYHVLESKIAIGLLSETVALPVFEATIVKQLKKAMTKAIEDAIISGTGLGQPLGITKYSGLPQRQVIEMNADTIGTVSAWAEVEAAIPEAYEDGVIYMMAKATWEKYLNGMVDKNGQKIGLGKINEKGQKILNGREVLTVDKLPSFMTAAAGDIFAVVVDLSQYCLNSNLSMFYRKYYEERDNKWVHKALMIADGKMAIGEIREGESKKYVGAGGLIYIKKNDTASNKTTQVPPDNSEEV